LISSVKTLFAIVCVALWLCSAAMAQAVPQLKDGKVTGAGFVITLPPGINVQVAANPQSAHGFFLELPPRTDDERSNDPEIAYRYIAFDTKWDVGDMPSLDDAVQNITRNILQYIPAELVRHGQVSVDASLPARLGSLPARRLVLKYENTKREPAIGQMVIAYHARKDASAIVYLLVLNTTEQNFHEDVSLFSKVMAGFKLADQ
jgi:hypothetical protein